MRRTLRIENRMCSRNQRGHQKGQIQKVSETTNRGELTTPRAPGVGTFPLKEYLGTPMEDLSLLPNDDFIGHTRGS